MVILNYLARLGSEAKVDGFVDFMSDSGFDQQKVDFPYDPCWVKPGYRSAPDYKDNWIQYNLCSFANVVAQDLGGTPERYKGVIVNLAEESDPMWLAFGKYQEDRWICNNFTRTFASGYHAHMSAVRILRIIEPMMDELWVLDHAGLWESDDLEAGYDEFRKGLQRLKSLSEMLAKVDMEYGNLALTANRLCELYGSRSRIKGERLASAFDPHWLKPTAIKSTQ